MPRASRSSQIPEMQKNADGSVDIYFGPKAPAGKDANWVPTDPSRKFELMFRLYAPKPGVLREEHGCCRTSRRSQRPPERDDGDGQLTTPARIRCQIESNGGAR